MSDDKPDVAETREMSGDWTDAARDYADYLSVDASKEVALDNIWHMSELIKRLSRDDSKSKTWHFPFAGFTVFVYTIGVW